MTIDSIDTNRCNPVTSDARGLSRRIKQRRNRLRAKRRTLDICSFHTDLDERIDWLVDDYTEQVKNPAVSRHELSAIITGISGCLLARSACWQAQGWSDKAEEDRLSGLLIAEVAACASENPSVSDPPPYRGVRAKEFDHAIDALHDLAQAYREPKREGGEFVVWGCLSELAGAVAPVIPGTWPGPVILAEMCDAHFAVECPDPLGSPEGDTGPTHVLEKARVLLDEVGQLHPWTRICLVGTAVAVVIYMAALVASFVHRSYALELTMGITEATVAVLAVTGVVIEVRRTRRSSPLDESGGSA